MGLKECGVVTDHWCSQSLIIIIHFKVNFFKKMYTFNQQGYSKLVKGDQKLFLLFHNIIKKQICLQH